MRGGEDDFGEAVVTRGAERREAKRGGEAEARVVRGREDGGSGRTPVPGRADRNAPRRLTK